MPTAARIRVLGAALVAGAVVIAAMLATTRPWERASVCPPMVDHATWSFARRWDESLLSAIRRALPNPPVHARNLFHLSVAMWDAWAAYDATASGYVFKEKLQARDVSAARNETISYAAYRVLTARFIKGVGADKSLGEFDDLMDSFCLPIATTATYKSQAVDVVRDSSLLDASSDVTIDISPRAIGANALGSNDGHGRALNPATSGSYAPEIVRQGDFYRAIAEFWADGPSSETPPGHWNAIANAASDQLAPDLRIGGGRSLADPPRGGASQATALRGAADADGLAAPAP